MGLRSGDQITFTPDKGKKRQGIIEKISRSRGAAMVTLDGDPFPVKVRIEQIRSCTNSGKNVSSTKVRKSRPSQGESRHMTTTTRTSAKELRQKAQALGIEGYEDMGRSELTAAVKAASGDNKPKTTRKRRTTSKPKAKTTSKSKPATKKAATKKAPAKKAATAKAAPKAKSEPAYTDPPKGASVPEEGNPFRKGSNLHLIYPILCPRGGKRRTLAERLQKKVDLHPYSGKDEEIGLLDYDKRIILAAQTLRDKHGYAIERQGRGLDGSIKVFVPGGENDPRGTAAKPARKRSSAKK